jgi:hypothetical protein
MKRVKVVSESVAEIGPDRVYRFRKKKCRSSYMSNIMLNGNSSGLTIKPIAGLLKRYRRSRLQN